MCARVCEAKTVYLAGNSSNHLIPLESYLSKRADCTSKPSENLLESVHWINYSVRPNAEEGLSVHEIVQNFYAIRQRFDTVFVTGPMLPEVMNYVSNCNRHWGRVNAVWNDLSGRGTSELKSEDMKNWMIMRGTTDIVLRYLAEASDAGLLERVERIDELYDLDRPIRVQLPTVESQQAEESIGSGSIERPISEWRCCRVFISSTFRDMHAERDLICGTILPSVRAYAARELRVHVNEVDLRWGVPEPVTRSPLALQMCLEQVVNTDILVLLVGNREIPETYITDFEERNEAKRQRLESFKQILKDDGVVVCDNYPAWFNGVIADRPVMANLGKLGHELTDSLHQAVNTLFKDSASNFLEMRILQLPHRATDYRTFLYTFVEPIACAISPRQLLQIERAIPEMDIRGKQCHKIRLLAAERVAPPSSGTQRVSLSRLLDDNTISPSPVGFRNCQPTNPSFDVSDPREKLLLQTKARSTTSYEPNYNLQRPKLPFHYVIPHFVDGLSATGLTPKNRLIALLDAWIERLLFDAERAATSSLHVSKRLQQIKEGLLESPGSQGVASDAMLHNVYKLNGPPLQSSGFGTEQDDDHTSDPACHGHNVRFVISCDANSTIARDLASRPDCLALTISGLNVSERAAAVRTLFGRYGKVLNESAFGNQLSLLVNNPSAEIPLFLRLACDELRLYGTYENLDAQLRQLPDSITKLVQHVIARVQAMCGPQLTLTALAFICASPRPLAGTELHALLDAWLLNSQETDDSKRDPVDSLWLELDMELATMEDMEFWFSFEQKIHALLTGPNKANEFVAKKARVHLPALAFHILLSGLRPLLAGFGDEEDVECDTSSTEDNLTALDLRKLPRGWIRFRSQEIANIVQDTICERTTGLTSFARLGFHQPTIGIASFDHSKRTRVDGTAKFVKGTRYPFLIGQLAINDASDGWIRKWGSVQLALHRSLIASVVAAVSHGSSSPHVRTFVCRSLPSNSDQSTGIVSPSAIYTLLNQTGPGSRSNVPTAIACSPNGQLLVIGTSSGTISVMELATFRELRSLFGHRNSVLSLCFLPTTQLGIHNIAEASECWLASTAQDGSVFLWNLSASVDSSGQLQLSNCSRLISLTGPPHRGAVTSCAWHPERRLLATGGLDRSVVLWTLPITARELSELQTHNTRQPLLNFDVIRTGSACVSSVAFRLPTMSRLNETGAAALRPCDVLAIGCWDGNVRIYNLYTSRYVKILPASMSAICSVAYSLDGGSTLATQDCRGQLFLWDSPWRTPAAWRTGSFSHVSAFTTDPLLGRLAVIGSNEGAIGFVCMRTGQLLHTIQGGRSRVQAVACSVITVDSTKLSLSCRMLLIVGSSSGLVRLLSQLPVVRTRRQMSEGTVEGKCQLSELVPVLPAGDDSDSLLDEAVARDGGVLCVSADHLVTILPASMSAICSVAYSLDGGSTLATQDCRGQLFLWDSESYTLLSGITSNFVQSTPASASSELVECYRGQIYFSRPRGRYLVQSGGILQKIGEITVWNSQLGASSGPWRTPAAWRTGSFSHVSAFTTDPLLGRLAVIGSNEGAIGFVCMRTGQLLHTIQGGRSRVQAVACSVITVDSTKLSLSCRMLLIVGSSSGLVRTYSFLASYPLSGTDESMSEGTVEGKCQLSELVPVLPAGDDSDSLLDEAVARDGGVLCVSADHLVTVSGNGDASCEVHFYRYDNNQVQCPNRVHVPSLGAAVTAVALGKPLLAVGATNRVSVA
ncbi:hypothetical protein AHF37_01244 [Paragonimus kellicotti]|nr:hypothetical protein AHF37_01244 [Paragonimus kellicotti]